ncbi:hypothetical protein [Helicobacter salomonis]|uniref:hypothetical protein n=1 Tax=Helicobacter salomonis TaxID=56878 RepID=UPI000CF0540A|nr:hypothetical protein [Helicobacter salomonis]
MPKVDESRLSTTLSTLKADKEKEFEALQKRLEANVKLSEQDREALQIPAHWILPTLCQFCPQARWTGRYDYSKRRLEIECLYEAIMEHTFKSQEISTLTDQIVLECDSYDQVMAELQEEQGEQNNNA